MQVRFSAPRVESPIEDSDATFKEIDPDQKVTFTHPAR